MNYKAKVRTKIPNARLIVLRYERDQVTPRYQRVVAGSYGAAISLDIHVPEGFGADCKQSANAAWRSAYLWLVRHPGFDAASLPEPAP